MEDLNLGQRIKEIRLEKRMTLQQVADGAELSKSFVSQVETGTTQPSIGSLKRIVDVLGIPLAALFTEDTTGDGPKLEESPVKVVRKDRRKHLRWPSGAVAELLTPDLRGKLEVILTEVDPATDLHADPYTHEGEEFGFVLEGTYEAIVQNERYVLEAGDSIYFQSHMPHSVRAIGKDPVKVLWVITPPSF